MNQENPFGGFGVQQVQFGVGPETKSELPQAAPNKQPALITDTTTADFAADVIQESRRQPVLVDFWAPWCGPCKQLTPILEKSVAEAGGRVRLVKMNIDEHPSVAGQLGIQSIPAVIAFKDGRPVDGFMGAIPESQIREFIQKIGGDADDSNRIEAVLTSAGEAARNGDWSTAVQMYTAVLQEAPGHLDATVGLAGVLFEAGDLVRAKQVLESIPEGKSDHAAVAGIRAKIALADQTSSLGDSDDLMRRLELDAADHQARFDLAMLQNAQGHRSEAADNLMAIMKADRSWEDDRARTQLLLFFEAWGMNDEATLTARRKLSSLLFS